MGDYCKTLNQSDAVRCINCQAFRQRTSYHGSERICDECKRDDAPDEPAFEVLPPLYDVVSAEYRLYVNYGITVEQKNRQLEIQGGKCLICKCELKIGKRGMGKLHIDHCHTTGKVRGLLCMSCNLSIGVIETKPDGWLERALEYISTEGDWQAGTVESESIERVGRSANG